MYQWSISLINSSSPEVFPSFWAFMVEFVRQIGDKVLEMSELQGTPHFLIRVGVEGIKVHAEGAWEQHRVLGKKYRISPFITKQLELIRLNSKTSCDVLQAKVFIMQDLPVLKLCRVSSVSTWGMMVMRDRRSWSPISAMSTPSIKIFPFAASRILKIPRAREDFPAPVLPTIPTWEGFVFTVRIYTWSFLGNILWKPRWIRFSWQIQLIKDRKW